MPKKIYGTSALSENSYLRNFVVSIYYCRQKEGYGTLHVPRSNNLVQLCIVPICVGYTDI